MNKLYDLVWRGMLLLFEIFVQRMMKCVEKKNDWMLRLWSPRIDVVSLGTPAVSKDQNIIGTLKIMEILSGERQHRGGEFCTGKLRFQEI